MAGTRMMRTIPFFGDPKMKKLLALLVIFAALVAVGCGERRGAPAAAPAAAPAGSEEAAPAEEKSAEAEKPAEPANP